MRLILRCASVALLALALAACGIPEETHNAVVKDLEKCKNELASTKGALDQATGEKDKLKSEVDELAKKKEALLKEMGATKKELEELRKAREAAEARAKVYRQLMDRLRSMIAAGKLQVEIRKGRMIVKMSDKILFDPGKTMLKGEGKTALQQLAAVLKDIADRDFLVSGHTDNVPIKTAQFKSNWELSAARGVEVVKFLQAEGVDPKHLGAAGYSEYDPAADNSTDEGKRANRRIEIVLMPNIEELPSISE